MIRFSILAGALAPCVAAAVIIAAVLVGRSLHDGRPGISTSATPQPGAPSTTATPWAPSPVPARVIPWAPLPPTAVIPTPPVSPPTPGPPPGAAPCRAADLEAVSLGVGGATQHSTMPVVLRNRGTHACILLGFADIRILDSADRVLAQAVGVSGRGTFLDAGDPSAVLMRHQPCSAARP